MKSLEEGANELEKEVEMTEQVGKIHGLQAYEIQFKVGNGRKVHSAKRFYKDFKSAADLAPLVLEESYTDVVKIVSIAETIVEAEGKETVVLTGETLELAKVLAEEHAGSNLDVLVKMMLEEWALVY